MRPLEQLVDLPGTDGYDLLVNAFRNRSANCRSPGGKRGKAIRCGVIRAHALATSRDLQTFLDRNL